MNIRLLYLYLFAFIGLLICVIGAVQLVDLGLTVLVFPDSDNYEYYAPLRDPGDDASDADLDAIEAEQAAAASRQQTRQRQRQLITSVSMLVVGAPLYIYHWRIISRDNQAGEKVRKK